MMRKTVFLLLILLILVLSPSLVAGAPKDLKILKEQPFKFEIIRPPYLLLRLPDLVVDIEGPINVAAGDDIMVTVTVKNNGNINAPGSSGAGIYDPRYIVDLILSADSAFPIEIAIQPVYAGATIEDFVEDMLFAGGRISNTNTIPPGGTETYSLSIHVPGNIAPGTYYVAAVADPAKMIAEISEANNTYGYQINIGAPRPGTITPPAGVDFWVMPYGIGNTTVNNIKPTGFTDYRDGGTGWMMIDAPFGGRLGFRLGYQHNIPRPQIYYYRWLYKKDGTSLWNEFTEPVNVHYVRELGTVVSFPVFNLGPKAVAGKNLYRFRPHVPPVETPAVTYWPTTDWFGDIYSGFLKSNTLPKGRYTIKLEIYNSSGVQVMPSSANNFIVPNGVLPNGTITTRLSLPAEIDAGGFIFPIFIDNQTCSAYIDAPAIGSNAASDECGFLIYGSPSDNVSIAFDAMHPDGRAMFSFSIRRGIVGAVHASGEVSAAIATPFNGDGLGNFYHTFTVAQLLSPTCPTQAAFSENLHVYAKATRGWHHRISGYDAHFVRAFALAP